MSPARLRRLGMTSPYILPMSRGKINAVWYSAATFTNDGRTGEERLRIDTGSDQTITSTAMAKQLRPHLSGTSADDFNRMTTLWSLDDASIAVCRRYFTAGLFMYPTGDWNFGCLEDPIFYRDGEIMFGIVTHEREGLLSLSPDEHAQVALLGIRTRDEPEWL